MPAPAKSIPRALTIAGSDSGGGAGIQADLKTFQELGVYGMSALTAITAQNTLGVQGVYPLEPEAVAAQLESVGTDLPPAAVKTGMLFSGRIIGEVAAKAEVFEWRRLVVDPVMIAKGGSALLLEEAVDTLRRRLLPLAEVVTPNLPEAEALTGRTIRSLPDREAAARQLADLGVRCVVIKGGHDEAQEAAVDLVFDGQRFTYLESPRVFTPHTHGTGCTFSAAVAAGLAQNLPLLDAVRLAKAFIQAAIEDSLGFGGGHGPTNHFAYRRRKEGLR
ncbi:bifunctional hydroxymethylpyrimidine kinase/phosphomethylpyrimidine kinase [Gorillibacterium sp. sgz500922]|uniref:bifunctional hydroxymethylpyrimidine kinase/phosphomethylpyrimidine kinase n=1 Tax=Gorillibacterium sp. sgz500922 TaxID=3446694 RepID=UPI003F671346